MYTSSVVFRGAGNPVVPAGLSLKTGAGGPPEGLGIRGCP